jgi:hypothetical protein
LHDAVFDHPTKETAARTKLNSILKTIDVVEILKGAVGFHVKFVTGMPMWSDPVRYTSDQVPPTESKTSAFVPTAPALEALVQPSLPDLEAMQWVHDIWCHPGNDQLKQIYQET